MVGHILPPIFNIFLVHLIFKMLPRKNQTFSHHQNIWIVTSWKFKSPTALRRKFRKYFKFSPRQLLYSYAFPRVINIFTTFGDVSPSRSSSIQSYRRKHWYSKKNLFQEKDNSFISLSELVNTVERYAAILNQGQLITSVNDILPRAQDSIKSDGGAFEYKLKSFKERLNR